MAQFVFYVGRKGNAGVKCTASVPGPGELPTFKGGTVKVQTPEHGEVDVEVGPAMDMLVQALTIQLQNGVRDVVFPQDDSTTKGTSKRTTGFVE